MSICIYFQSLPSSFEDLSIHPYPQIYILYIYKIRRASFCVQVSTLSWGMQQLPAESSVMMLESRGTLPRSRSAIIIQPVTVHLPDSVCNCLPLPLIINLPLYLALPHSSLCLSSTGGCLLPNCRHENKETL